MRKTLAQIINAEDYLIHADMFNTTKFPTQATVINVGLGESNLLNIAAGIASQGKTVYVYGVAGFIIHHLQQLKLSCKYFGAKTGKIIICNAGKYGYEAMGIGHALDDDKQIMEIYDIPFFEPNNIQEFKQNLDIINNNQIGLYYIRLGKDY